MITKDTNGSTESLEYTTLGLSIDNLTALNLIKKPDLLKIDVDGNELDVIEGCRKTIEQSNTISILIETRQETEINIKKEFEILGLNKSNKSRNNEIWEK